MAFPWKDGNYKVEGINFTSVIVDGARATSRGSGGVFSEEMTFKQGTFGEADEEIAAATGQKINNIEMRYRYLNKDVTDLGVVSEDGLKITTKSGWGIVTYDWITEEEAAALEDVGDPIEAPPNHYKLQPNNLGKFIWITGGPGLGKSTSAHLLSKMAGFVYYEGDCFESCKNPYIPPLAKDPTMHQVLQRPLKGKGRDERLKVCEKAFKEFEILFKGEEYDENACVNFYMLMCEDIERERRRIGGDWVVATVVQSKAWRDLIKAKLGPDLVFVVLDMDPEEQIERIKVRHAGDEEMVELMSHLFTLCEPAQDDEENTLAVKVTGEMSREDVVKKIMEMIK